MIHRFARNRGTQDIDRHQAERIASPRISTWYKSTVPVGDTIGSCPCSRPRKYLNTGARSVHQFLKERLTLASKTGSRKLG